MAECIVTEKFGAVINNYNESTFDTLTRFREKSQWIAVVAYIFQSTLGIGYRNEVAINFETSPPTALTPRDARTGKKKYHSFLLSVYDRTGWGQFVAPEIRAEIFKKIQARCDKRDVRSVAGAAEYRKAQVQYKRRVRAAAAAAAGRSTAVYRGDELKYMVLLDGVDKVRLPPRAARRRALAHTSPSSPCRCTRTSGSARSAG